MHTKFDGCVSDLSICAPDKTVCALGMTICAPIKAICAPGMAISTVEGYDRWEEAHRSEVNGLRMSDCVFRTATQQIIVWFFRYMHAQSGSVRYTRTEYERGLN